MQDETSFPCSEYPPTGLYAKRNQYTAILRTIPLRWIILPLRFVFWRELFPLWPHSQILAASFHFLRTLYKLRPFYPPWSIHPSMSPRTKHQCRSQLMFFDFTWWLFFIRIRDLLSAFCSWFGTFVGFLNFYRQVLGYSVFIVVPNFHSPHISLVTTNAVLYNPALKFCR